MPFAQLHCSGSRCRGDGVDNNSSGSLLDDLVGGEEVVYVTFVVRFLGCCLVDNPVVVDNELFSGKRQPRKHLRKRSLCDRAAIGS